MKICFVAQHIYPYFWGSKGIKTAGGAELQQMFIGMGLKTKGVDVSYVTMDYNQHDEEIINGFKIYKTFKPNEGIFILRFFYPRLLKIWRALKKADADLYYIRAATFLPGIIALFCKLHNKKMIFAGAHDTNFMVNNLRLPTKRDEFLYKFGLRKADAIIVQSKTQKKLLLKNFRKIGTVIQNFYPYTGKCIPVNEREFILWVSTIKPWKRPELYIQLAEKFPSEKFVMIGGKPGLESKNYFEEVRNKAERIGNIKFLGFQPFDATEKYFDKCKLFINTSKYEGFPNTFLQAWNRGVPVVSYVDPDNIIKNNKLGYKVNSKKEMEKALILFLRKKSWDEDAILNYFKKNHSSDVIDKYHSMMYNVLK